MIKGNAYIAPAHAKTQIVLNLSAMKHFFLFLLLLPLGISAQIVRIDSLPSQGILLDHGWKWKAEDNPAFHLPKIEVVPQEIGRVLLNLLNNAFYAVNERAKQGEAHYQPTVTVFINALPQRGGL